MIIVDIPLQYERRKSIGFKHIHQILRSCMEVGEGYKAPDNVLREIASTYHRQYYAAEFALHTSENGDKMFAVS
jgi:hypothetical protein